jgi:(p)ppGpp synthase/HD superfamily hydrolase
MKKGELLDRMIFIVTNAHHGQYDKGGAPYILHPLKVMHYLNSEDEELQCIALGHDVIEDTDVTYKDLIDAGMTDRIIEGIKCLTKVPGDTLDEYKVKVKSNRDAILVKMCDLRHNSDIRRLKGVTDKDVQRMVRYNQFYLELQEALNEI